MEGEDVPAELLLLKCTERQTRVCQLLRHLTKCNDVLWEAGLQLREDPRDEPGCLSVAKVPGVCSTADHCPRCVRNEKPALALLELLFRTHSCIVSLEADYRVAITSALVEATASSSSLLRLVIFGIEGDAPEGAEQMEDSIDEFASPYMQHADIIDTAVHLLVKDQARLVSLDLRELEMTSFTAEYVIDALMKNGTVEELAFPADALTSVPDGGTVERFTRFLRKKETTLRKLIIKGNFLGLDVNGWHTLAHAISEVTTLEDLTLEVNANKENCVLFLEAVAQGKCVRRLTLLSVEPTDVPSTENPHGNDGAPSWALALQGNNTMQNVDLDVSWASERDLEFLLEAFAKNSNLQGLTLRYYEGDLTEPCRIMRELGLVQRVRIEHHVLYPGEDNRFSKCELAASIRVWSYIFRDDLEALKSIFPVMATCRHVTSLYVTLEFFDEVVFSLLAACLAASTSLKKTDVVIHILDPDLDAEVLPSSMLNLCKALSSNISLTSIKLTSTVCLQDEECKVLADAPSNNRDLHEFCVSEMEDESVVAFLDRLLARLDQNYSLLLLDVSFCVKPDHKMRAAQDVVRRNCSLVERATRFVMGNHYRDFACAFEILSEEPVLLMNVRQKATVSDQAESMIREARNFLRNANLHTYMRLAGVVKHRARCDHRDTLGRQLDRLPYDCWLLIRRHLKIADVVDP
ncbi:hypothetical protein HPB50_021666 [Hyalomma asiaticum]|uniref:Uncharacterized protein n=1 Tax=Hyalomma asiaticum TaxID=266040 RepID=A0ACB7TF10_HYAAI|nr:hypothetical protein HPB50_021666 [Hyalomma asiaticum]